MGAGWEVTDAATGRSIPVQATPIDARTLQLPLLYINHYGLNASAEAAAVAAHTNKATHVLVFAGSLPAVGYNVFAAKKAAGPAAAAAAATKGLRDTPSTVTNGVYSVDISGGVVTKVTNIKSGVSTPLGVTWGYYESSEGGCTYWPNGTKIGCSNQASGAYMFRPINQTTKDFGTPTIEVTTGPLLTEIKQTFSEWATHVIRLKNNSAFIEVSALAANYHQPADNPLLYALPCATM